MFVEACQYVVVKTIVWMRTLFIAVFFLFIFVLFSGPEKCSMAEIEHKKLQALERRRQRLQASQSLRAQP